MLLNVSSIFQHGIFVLIFDYYLEIFRIVRSSLIEYVGHKCRGGRVSSERV